MFKFVVCIFLGVYACLGFTAPIETPSIKVNYSSQDELSEQLETLVSKESVSKIFDHLENGKVVLQLINDNNFRDPNSPEIEKLNDDIGRTHGFQLAIYKNIAPMLDGSDKYYVAFTYKTDLYTNITEPKAFPIDFYELAYLNDAGYWQVDVFFKEENLAKAVIGQVKTKDAFYWEVDVGYHEINASDVDRGFILSGLQQQQWLHRGVNEVMGRTLREYNYLPVTGLDQSGAMIDIEAGVDQTLLESENARSFIRTGLMTRATEITRASFVGAYFGAYQDLDPSFFPAIRLHTNYTHKEYEDSQYREVEFGLRLQSEYLGIEMKYIRPLDTDPLYLQILNPIPGITLPQTRAEPLVFIGIEGEWK